MDTTCLGIIVCNFAVRFIALLTVIAVVQAVQSLLFFERRVAKMKRVSEIAKTLQTVAFSRNLLEIDQKHHSL